MITIPGSGRTDGDSGPLVRTMRPPSAQQHLAGHSAAGSRIGGQAGDDAA